MPVYVCLRGDCSNLALEEPGCFLLRDALGRDWFCVQTDLSEIPEDLGALLIDQVRAQMLAHKHGLSAEGTAQAMLLEPDVESLARRLVLTTYPDAGESAARLREAGWLNVREEWGTGRKVRVSVSNGQRTVEAEGGNKAEAWHRAAQIALQEKPPMTPTIQSDPPALRADQGGALRVGESQVLLDVLVREFEAGADPESIARAYPTVRLADVYAAIAYYLRHKEEFDAFLKRRREEATELRQEIEGRQPGAPAFAQSWKPAAPNRRRTMLPLMADENVNGAIIRGLRRRQPGIDLIFVQEVGLDHTPDPDILEWAAAEGRIVITEDVNTMVGFAWDRVRAALPMPGVIVRPEGVTVRQAIDDLLVAANCGAPEDFKDQVQFLPL